MNAAELNQEVQLYFILNNYQHVRPARLFFRVNLALDTQLVSKGSVIKEEFQI